VTQLVVILQLHGRKGRGQHFVALLIATEHEMLIVVNKNETVP
jgi:hypothetical protein